MQFIHSKPLRREALLVACLACPAAAFGATATTSFTVTATVVATCAVSAGNLGFGNYATTVLDATTTISVTCTNLTPYLVELDAGIGSGATVAARRMTGPSSETLSYSLYQDAGRLLVWGPTSALQSVAGTGNGAAQTLTVYGRVNASQSPQAGSYADTITVTVTY